MIYEHHEEFYKNLIYNQDVSQATMCGNATKCFAKLIFPHTKDSIISVKAHDKSLSCKLVNETEIPVKMLDPSVLISLGCQASLKLRNSMSNIKLVHM